MSDELKDLGFVQNLARVLFACAATALVAVLAYFGFRWLFGIH
jgi:hypothetical protein